jgi:15-cis-phytoene synthase/lycopene beta-cyclase
MSFKREALFFLMTNMMIVFGMTTIDHALAIAEYDMIICNLADSHRPSFFRIFWSYMTSQRRCFDTPFLKGLNAAIKKLSQKSQTMYLGSAMFSDRLRVDLIMLYEMAQSRSIIINLLTRSQILFLSCDR